MTFIELKRRNLYATVELVDVGDGFSCEFWVSGKYGDDLRLLGCFSFPIYGFNEDEARRRVEYLRELVFDFSEHVMGGSGAIHTRIDAYKRQEIAKKHIDKWWAEADVKNIETLAAFYNLMCEFKLKNPAVVLAELYGIPVRTMHDRLAGARGMRLIKEVGRGKSW
jgi:hypothetical protein